MSSLAFSSDDVFDSAARRSAARRNAPSPPVIRLPIESVPIIRASSTATVVATPRLKGWWLVLVVLGIHAAVLLLANTIKTVEESPQAHLLKLNFTRPEPVTPPPPQPPQVKPQTVHKPLPQRVETTPVELPKSDAPVDNGQAAVPIVAGPVAEPVIAPPAPPAPAPEPLVEAHGGIGYLNNPQPEYPRQAELLGWQGRVVLLVHVSPDGRPLKIDVKTSSGHDLLDQSAADTVLKTWRFAPAHRGSTPVEGTATVPISFRL